MDAEEERRSRVALVAQAYRLIAQEAEIVMIRLGIARKESACTTQG